MSSSISSVNFMRGLSIVIFQTSWWVMLVQICNFDVRAATGSGPHEQAASGAIGRPTARFHVASAAAPVD
jgi:hypothetical protein